MREIKVIAEKDLEKKMCESDKLIFYSDTFNNFPMINGQSLFLVPSIVIVTVKIPWPLSSTEIYLCGLCGFCCLQQLQIFILLQVFLDG